MPAFRDITGQRFGSYQALRYEGLSRWTCRCDCGRVKSVRVAHLLGGNATRCEHCKCAAATIGDQQRTHGGYGEDLYGIWRGIISRCENENREQFRHYGGRGITVCERWRRSYLYFKADMGPRPSRKHSIERINNEGNYEPANCIWATAKQQANNRRRRNNADGHDRAVQGPVA